MKEIIIADIILSLCIGCAPSYLRAVADVDHSGPIDPAQAGAQNVTSSLPYNYK
jgi:hypothetical protein